MNNPAGPLCGRRCAATPQAGGAVLGPVGPGQRYPGHQGGSLQTAHVLGQEVQHVQRHGGERAPRGGEHKQRDSREEDLVLHARGFVCLFTLGMRVLDGLEQESDVTWSTLLEENGRTDRRTLITRPSLHRGRGGGGAGDGGVGRGEVGVVRWVDSRSREKIGQVGPAKALDTRARESKQGGSSVGST